MPSPAPRATAPPNSWAISRNTSGPKVPAPVPMSGVTSDSTRVKRTMTTMSLMIVVPRITSLSFPFEPVSSITPMVRSGEELAAQTPSSRASPTVAEKVSPSRKGRNGLTASTATATPSQTTRTTDRVVKVMALADGLSSLALISPPASMAMSARANSSMRRRSSTAVAGMTEKTEGPARMPMTM